MNPRQPDPSSPRPLDRALSLPLLETVHRIASLDASTKERSAQLTVALREHTTDADAKAGLKWAVSRIWINPPPPAAAMIRWAIDNPEHFPDRRLMHTGALMATVPFVGSALGQLGRSFALDQTLTVPDLRRRLVARWGRDLHRPGGCRQDHHQPPPPRHSRRRRTPPCHPRHPPPRKPPRLSMAHTRRHPQPPRRIHRSPRSHHRP